MAKNNAYSSISFILFWTNSVVAICVLLEDASGVGADTFPVKEGSLNNVSFDSFVTLPRPTCSAVT